MEVTYLAHMWNDKFGKKYDEFCTTVLNRSHDGYISAGDMVLLRNLKVMRVAALLVFLTDIFWLIKNIQAVETEKLYTGSVLISGYIHIGLSGLMTVVAYFVHKITDKNRGFLNSIFLIFYVYTIMHVAIYAVNFNNRAMLAEANTEFVGIAVSTFYLFIIAFAPIDEWYYTLMLGVLSVIGFLIPMAHPSVAYYAVVEQAILRIFLMAAYLLIRAINKRLTQHELYLMQLTDSLTVTSYVDNLTNVLNRRAMDAYWNYMSESLHIENVGVLLYDVDNFKNFNDNYSHLMGDAALCNVCTAVVSAIADEKDVFLFRYGGEEFVVLYPEPTKESIRRIASKLVMAVYDMNMPRNDIEGRDRVTITVGCAIISVAEVTTEDYIKAADKQTYIGKRKGKNCYVIDGNVVRPTNIQNKL